MAIFLIFLILALYFVNMSLDFVKILKIEDWIVLIGGILIFIGGFNFLKVKRHNF